MKNITLFCNSVGFYKEQMPHHEGTYIKLLQEYYNVRGMWSPGLNCLHVAERIRIFTRYEEPVIIHVGICECITRKPADFLKMAIDYLLNWGTNSNFASFILPKMKFAVDNLDLDDAVYIRYLTPQEFEYIYSSLVRIFAGRQGVLIGLCKPNVSEDRHHWISQAAEFNGIIQGIAQGHGQIFIDAWNLTNGHTSDSTHLDAIGHRIIFEEIRKVVE